MCEVVWRLDEGTVTHAVLYDARDLRWWEHLLLRLRVMKTDPRFLALWEEPNVQAEDEEEESEEAL